LPRKGRISFSDTHVNPATGAGETRAEIANADGARSQFARVELEAAVLKDAHVVPQVAVRDGPRSKFVGGTGAERNGNDAGPPRRVVRGDRVTADAGSFRIVEMGPKTRASAIVDGIARRPPGARGTRRASPRAALWHVRCFMCRTI
jgi:multidrug efflux pump subunit AcrA (membrane-fusion protein)